MKRLLKRKLVLAILILIVGCNVTYENLVLNYFDSENKSITIISGTDPLILGIKKEFIVDGWQVLTFSESFDQDNISFSEIETKYIMTSEYDQGDDFFYGPFVQSYRFTIYDTDSGFEVVILYGSQRTVEQVINEIKHILENNYERKQRLV